MNISKKKILVVDDDRDIRELITFILNMEGFDINNLDSGHEVISNIASDRPDLVLLDVRLGDMDGRDICKCLKQSHLTNTIPIIIISATHGRHTMGEKNCGADDYIAKPFDVDALVEMVKYYIGKGEQSHFIKSPAR